jgi:hypothetical protein
MTVTEYRPSAESGQWKQPDHLSDRPSFNSKRLGRIVSTAGVPHLSWEDADELFLELTQEIHTLASRISSQQWPLPDLRRMKAKKARWGAVHQALLQRRAVKAKIEKRRQHLVDRKFPDLFVDIAREKLPESLFRELVESTMARQAEFQSELAGIDAAPCSD